MPTNATCRNCGQSSDAHDDEVCKNVWAKQPPSAPDTPTPADKHTAGIYGKFVVRRRDGTDAPGQKHDGCEYFVLDLTHDPYALPAIAAYARECADESPALARDLDAICIRHNCATALAGIQDDPRSLPPGAPDTTPDELLRTPDAVKDAWGDVEELAFGAGVDMRTWMQAVARFWRIANLANEPVSSSPPEDEDTKRLEAERIRHALEVARAQCESICENGEPGFAVHCANLVLRAIDSARAAIPPQENR